MRRFSVQYQDGSKRNIGASKKQQLLDAGEIVSLGNDRFAYTGRSSTLHSMSALGKLPPPPTPFREIFIGLRFKLRGKTVSESGLRELCEQILHREFLVLQISI